MMATSFPSAGFVPETKKQLLMFWNAHHFEKIFFSANGMCPKFQRILIEKVKPNGMI